MNPTKWSLIVQVLAGLWWLALIGVLWFRKRTLRCPHCGGTVIATRWYLEDAMYASVRLPKRACWSCWASYKDSDWQRRMDAHIYAQQKKYALKSPRSST